MTDDPLAALRREIDRIDAELHGLLMARGEIIDRLIAAKGTAASGSAFRPEREAAMLRVLTDRHRGRLPLDSIEGIWRIIISTFTHVQAPFRVHAAAGGRPGEAEAIRDSARFHFGFTVPLVTHGTAAEIVAAVAGSRGDLGLLPSGPGPGAWWQALAGEGAPKVIARLPFVERPGHPAPLPLLVVSRGVSEEGLGKVALHATPGACGPETLARIGGEIVAVADGSSLVATPRGLPEPDLLAALGPGAAFVGSHPAPIGVRATG